MLTLADVDRRQLFPDGQVFECSPAVDWSLLREYKAESREVRVRRIVSFFPFKSLLVENPFQSCLYM